MTYTIEAETNQQSTNQPKIEKMRERKRKLKSFGFFLFVIVLKNSED